MDEGHGTQANGVWSLQSLTDMSVVELCDWQVLLENRTGMVLNEQRRTFPQASLTARMRELGIDDYHSYYRQVTDDPRGAVEWATPLDHLTAQETRFFRHPLSSELPERYLSERLRREGMLRPWALWSVGCPSGEEPCSPAMCVAQVLRGQEREDSFGVTGTDISLHALQRARQANYSARKLEQLKAGSVKRYCERQADGSFNVKTILTKRVCCARLNVLDLAKMSWSGMDVIFCQNLLIYFRRWRRRGALSRLAERLAPGGLLVIGVSEVADWSYPEPEPVADEWVLAFTRKGYSDT